MRIVFVRHGERRRNEIDAGLTSAGRRMARETGLWLRDQGVLPVHFVHTNTRRTEETAEELALVLEPRTTSRHDEEPQAVEDWLRVVDALRDAPGLAETVLLVGHHPTTEMLLRAFGPPPVPVPRAHFASALVLESPDARDWTIAAAWPGRFA